MEEILKSEGYRGKSTPWRLSSMSLKDLDYKEKPAIGYKWIIASVIIFVVMAMYEARANTVGYGFPHEESPMDVSVMYESREEITMDVRLVDGVSGTYRCPSVRACYIKSLQYEARGAAQYCVSLIIKRNGRVIWYKVYQNN